MLIGNPHEFAIWLEPVREWTIQSTVEGLFILCIDGVFLIKKPTLNARAVTLSGESEFWTERLVWMDNGKQTETRGRKKEELFASAEKYWYGAAEYENSVIDGVDLTPMETADSFWKVYLFLDSDTHEDVIVYSNFDEGSVMELRLPASRIRVILLEFIEQTKIFDQKELFGLQS